MDCGSTKWQQLFTFDPFGNISKSGTGVFAPTYSTATNQFTVIPGIGAPYYDANGNLTKDNLNTYSWDPNWGNPASVNSTNLIYDAFGQMVEQQNGAANTQMLYSQAGKTAIMNGQTLIKAFVNLPGGGTAIYNTSSGSPVYYRHSDWLGSARLTSTATRTVYSDSAYAPFGEQYAPPSAADVSFTGQNTDTTSTLYDFTFRELSPTQGRWISTDPAGLGSVDLTTPQSWNRYAYVVNNPLSYIDPLGLWCVWGDGTHDDEEGGANIQQCEDQGGYWDPSNTITGCNDNTGSCTYGGPTQTVTVSGANNWGPLYPPSMFTRGNNMPVVSQWRPPMPSVTAPYKPLPYKPSVGECFTNPGNAVELMAEGNGTPLNPEEHDPSAPVLVYQNTNRGTQSVNAEEAEATGNGLAILVAGAAHWFGCMAGALFGN